MEKRQVGKLIERGVGRSGFLTVVYFIFTAENVRAKIITKIATLTVLTRFSETDLDEIFWRISDQKNAGVATPAFELNIKIVLVCSYRIVMAKQ